GQGVRAGGEAGRQGALPPAGNYSPVWPRSTGRGAGGRHLPGSPLRLDYGARGAGGTGIDRPAPGGLARSTGGGERQPADGVGMGARAGSNGACASAGGGSV